MGEEIEFQLTVRATTGVEYVQVRDPRPAGFEPEEALSGYRYGAGLSWYQEVRDSATSFFVEDLPAGLHTFRHRVRASLAGEVRVGPATIQGMYAPELNATSSAGSLAITPGQTNGT